MNAKNIWLNLTDKNWKTWIGHSVLGLVIFFIVANLGRATTGVNWAVSAAAATAYFFGREVTNIEPYVVAYITDRTQIPVEKVIDGFFDFWAPTFVVIFLALILG